MLASRCFAILLIGLLVLCAFQSGALVPASYALPESPTSERFVVWAEIWHGWMGELGPAGVTEMISDRLEELRETPVTET